jgi:hypothetical protein
MASWLPSAGVSADALGAAKVKAAHSRNNATSLRRILKLSR